MGNLEEALSTNIIGVTAVVRWKDLPKGFPEYISLGEYIEEKETDNFGVNDLSIFYYAEGFKELGELMTNSSNEWLIEEITEIHYASSNDQD